MKIATTVTMTILSIVLMIMPAPAQSGPTWTPWVTVTASLGYDANPFVWFSDQPLGPPLASSTLFGPFCWNSFYPGMTVGGWNMRVLLDIAQGDPSTCTSPVTSGTELRIEVRMLESELLAPGVSQPSQMQVRLSNDGGVAPVLWRDVELQRVNFPPISPAFIYRRCFVPDPLNVFGEWGGDGTNTSCAIPGPFGVNEFEFSQGGDISTTQIGSPTGSFPTMGASISITPGLSQDSFTIELSGAQGATTAWLLIGPNSISSGLTFTYPDGGFPLTLYVSGWEDIGSLAYPVDSSGIAQTASFTVPPAWLLPSPVEATFQWFVMDANNPALAGLSSGFEVNIALSCTP